MGTPSNSSQPDSSMRIVCRVCGLAFPQLTCPRCCIRYCSPECYKSHKLHCRVSFPQRNVLDKLRLIQPWDEFQGLTLKLLKQQIEGAVSAAPDPDLEASLSEKVARNILSGIQLNLDDLGLEQQQQFKPIIAQPWNPWWLRPEIDGFPPGPEFPLPSIKQLREDKCELPPHLDAHLIDIIYSYCFTLRLFNGDWISDFVGAFDDFVSVSSVWGQVEPAKTAKTVSEVLSCCLEHTKLTTYDKNAVFGVPTGLSLMDDVVSILNLGREAIICLLCDLQRMSETVQKVVKSDDEELMAQLKSVEGKVYLVMCWANEQAVEVWDSLALIVKEVKSSGKEAEDREEIESCLFV